MSNIEQEGNNLEHKNINIEQIKESMSKLMTLS